MYYWWKGFGFTPVAYSGLETGNRRSASYVLESGKIRFVVTAAYSPTDEIAADQMLHGDRVKHVALGVDDVEQAYRATTDRGAVGVWAARETDDDDGTLRTSAIRTYGEVIHVFVDRSDYKGAIAPGYQPLDMPAESAGLAAIDHVVGNVQLGKMDHWVNFYHSVMGFRQLQHFDDQDIGTGYSALMSKVMQDGTGRVKFPINEPAEGKRKSQIEEYLDFPDRAAQALPEQTWPIDRVCSIRGARFSVAPGAGNGRRTRRTRSAGEGERHDYTPYARLPSV